MGEFDDEKTLHFEEPTNSTTFRVLTDIYGENVTSSPKLFIAAFAFTLAGIFIASKFFAEHMGIVSVFFGVLGLIPTFNILVEQNKGYVEELRMRAKKRTKADVQLARNLLAIVLGMLLAFSVWALLLSVPELKDGFKSQLGSRLDLSIANYKALPLEKIWLNNLAVAGGAFVLSLLYRLGGALLVLCWNASVWGVVFVYYAQLHAASGKAAVLSYLQIFGCVVGHTVFETMGYIMASLAGIMLLRLIVRADDEYISVDKTIQYLTVLFVGAILIIGVGAGMEVWLVPVLLSVLGV
ncbi:MAG: stage II sporulation protein M [Myxococcota bacterium]|nr:stage II sporulation protein M [Myxococcota bacterium]